MNNTFEVLKNLVHAIDSYNEREDVKSLPDTRPSDDTYMNAYWEAKMLIDPDKQDD